MPCHHLGPWCVQHLPLWADIHSPDRPSTSDLAPANEVYEQPADPLGPDYISRPIISALNTDMDQRMGMLMDYHEEHQIHAHVSKGGWRDVTKLLVMH